jgi:hypothetical protein
MALRWPWQRVTLPPGLREALDEDEHIQAVAELADGTVLAASRFGLWHVTDGGAGRTGWEAIAKARLAGSVLSIVPTRVVGELPDGTTVLRDDGVREYVLTGKGSLTDVVHSRVRRSVAASIHLSHPSGGGWVVLRRIPGRDGVVTQVRLDTGTDPEAPGFAEAVADVAAELASGRTPA